MVRPDVVWVEQLNRPDTFVLEPASISGFRKLLISSGFDSKTVEAYLRFSALRIGESHCLSLAADPAQCVNLALRLNADKQLELVANDESAQLAPDVVKNELSLVGSSYLYFGENRSRLEQTIGSMASRSTSAGMTHRGVVSSADTRLEYDVSAVATEQTGQGTKSSSNFLRFNTLAASAPVGVGRGFAGLSRAASGGQAFQNAGAQELFAKPAQIGLAWQSDNSNLSSAQRKRQVLVQLQSPAFVRIVSDGVQLYEANLPAGDNLVSFVGFAGPFVDVVVRESSGREQIRTTEVQTDYEPDAQVVSLGETRSLWYADVGRVMDNTQADNWRLKLSSAMQASASYSYLGDDLVYQVAGQAVNGLLRAGVALSDRDYRWRASAMAGRSGEYGLRFGFTPRLGDLRMGLTFTEYAPPASGGAVSGDCQESGNNFCLSNLPDGYRSIGLNAGVRGIPVNVGVQYSQFGTNSNLTYSANGSVGLNRLARGAFLTTSASYTPDSRAKSLNMSLMVPFDSFNGGSGYAIAGVGTNFDGDLQVSAGASRSFDPQQGGVLRSLSANVQQSLPKYGDDRISGIVQMGSQLGAVANTTSLSHDSGGSTGINTSFSANYGASPAGLAFGREFENVAMSDLYSGQGQAGVSVINRSQEVQTVVVQGRETVVQPNSNRLIPMPKGLVRDISVTPGPVANLEDARAGRLLYKGNIKSVTIGDGFWVLAKFFDANSPVSSGRRALPVEFSYKRPGERLERLYAGPTGDALLFEFKENGNHIERFISVQGSKQEYRCLANAEDIPTVGDVSSYKELVYSCQLIASNEPIRPDNKPDNLRVVQASPVPQIAMTPVVDLPVMKATPQTIEAESRPKPALAPIPLPQAIEQWRQAWQRQDIAAYLGWYSSDFKPNAQTSRSAWADGRRAVFARSKGDVILRISGLSITPDSTGQVAEFEQLYSANDHADRGRKTMRWRLVDGQWRIDSESFVAKR